MANRGLPPIAYTSLMAFVAAIFPKVNGSSTMGMKKSRITSYNVCYTKLLRIQNQDLKFFSVPSVTLW